MHVSIRGTCDDFHFSAHVFTLTFFKLSQQIFPEKQGRCSFPPLPEYSPKKLATSLAKEELTFFNPKFCHALISAMEGWKLNKIRSRFTLRHYKKPLFADAITENSFF